MDYAKLKQVIDTMPGITGATTDAEVLTWLTTPSVTVAEEYLATTRRLMADLDPAQRL